MRDSQQQRVYDAENALPDGRTYPTMREAVKRVNAIITSAWWKRNVPQKSRVRVVDGRGRRNACSFGGCIALPRWARNDRVILHELAHEANPRSEKHGPQFTRTYHDMLRRFMGADVASKYLIECAARVVRVAGKRLPRSKVTDEHRQAVANERKTRTARRQMGTFEYAVDAAKLMAAQRGENVTVQDGVQAWPIGEAR